MARPIHSTGPAGRFPGPRPQIRRVGRALRSAGAAQKADARGSAAHGGEHRPGGNRHGGGRQPPPAYQDLHLPASGAETWPTANGRRPVWLTSGWCLARVLHSPRAEKPTWHAAPSDGQAGQAHAELGGPRYGVSATQRQTARAPERGRGHPGRTAPAGLVPGRQPPPQQGVRQTRTGQGSPQGVTESGAAARPAVSGRTDCGLARRGRL